ncbi:MAG: nitronate monooxygenase, partial [Pseudomonadota bacterium]
MNKFRIIVETLPHILDPGIAIAATRAGGIGVLNLEYIPKIRSYGDQLIKLSQYTAGNAFGIKLGQDGLEHIAFLRANPHKQLKLAVVSAVYAGDLQKILTALQTLKMEVLVECINLQQAHAAERYDADAVIAKGQESGGRVGDETTFILLQRFVQSLKVPVYAKGGIGMHTGAACFMAGAAGVVLDNQ